MTGSSIYNKIDVMRKKILSFFSTVSLIVFCLLVSFAQSKQVQAKAIQTNTKIGTYFFNWYHCSREGGCTTGNKWGFIPDFMAEDYPEGGRYSSLNKHYYKREFYDMYSAGIDYAFIVSWGDHPWPYYRTRRCPWWYGTDLGVSFPSMPQVFANNPGCSAQYRSRQGWPEDLPREQNSNEILSPIEIMIQELEELSAEGIDIKIALFDDTQSEPAEFNLFERGFLGGEKYSGSNTPIGYDVAYKKFPLCHPKAANYFYNAKYKPFFNKIPKKFWATHNGRTLGNGGRPLIVLYGPGSWYDQHQCSHSVFQEVKERFKTDFGVEPYIIADIEWSRQNNEIANVIDNQTRFGAAITDINNLVTYTKHNYTVTNIGPGFNNAIMNPRNPGVFARGKGSRLIDHFNKAPPSDLLIIETWNELGERSSIARVKGYDCDRKGLNDCGYCEKPNPADCWPIQSHQDLPQTFYMQKLRELTGRNDRPIIIIDGSFENKTIGWEPSSSINPIEFYAVDSHQWGGGKEGRYYLKLASIPNPVDAHAASYWIDAGSLAGKSFTLSFWAKTDSGAKTISGIALQTYPLNGDWSNNTSIYKDIGAISVNSSWQKFTKTINFEDSVNTSSKIRIILRPTSDTQPVYFDAVVLKERTAKSDLNQDGQVDAADIKLLLSKYQTADNQADLTSDGRVNGLDFVELAKETE